MSKADEARAREQRLAAKLRENLKRRKQQARVRGAGDAAADGAEPDQPDASAALKPDGDSDT